MYFQCTCRNNSGFESPNTIYSDNSSWYDSTIYWLLYITALLLMVCRVVATYMYLKHFLNFFIGPSSLKPRSKVPQPHKFAGEGTVCVHLGGCYKHSQYMIALTYCR